MTKQVKWVRIKKFPEYYASRCGKILMRNGKISSRKPSDDGYIQVHFRNAKKGYNEIKRAHILIAQTFIPNPENKPQVNHINGIRHDNRVENLEWCTYSENVIKKVFHSEKCKPVIVEQYTLEGELIATFNSFAEAGRQPNISKSSIRAVCDGERKTYNGYIWKRKTQKNNLTRQVDQIDGEIWKPTSVDGIKVSSVGRVKNTYTGLITFGYKSSQGYLAYTNRKTNYYVHRLVGEAFLEKPNEYAQYINHIDNNKENNKVENLEWVTARENIIHGTKFRKNIKKVKQLTLDGKLVKIYDSPIEASKAVGHSAKLIRRVCSGDRKTTMGCRWEYC